MKRGICWILLIAIIFLVGCSAIAPLENSHTPYQSYKDIPGITPEEIAAIDSLLAAKPQLVYGVCLSTEAFFYEDGSMGGFSPLLTARMSELFGFSFAFYPCGKEEMAQKIESGQIDLTGDLTATPERLQKYMMTDAIIKRMIKVFTNADAEAIEETAKRRPAKCAFLNGSATYAQVEKSWSISFEPVFIDDRAVVPQMLQRGEIDAFIDEGTQEAFFAAYDFIAAEEYYPLTYVPISLSAANAEMAPIISIMQKYLVNGGSFELTELYNRGYKEYRKHRLFASLTEQEKEYIEKDGDGAPIFVAYEDHNYPISFYNVKDKQF